MASRLYRLMLSNPLTGVLQLHLKSKRQMMVSFQEICSTLCFLAGVLLDQLGRNVPRAC
ncbi:hypothetical protein [Prochlorococcus sp. MIT 1303]|uniref:hypothetical protein n=1 Tax=Prochlorococcus sp. MIT 1303 TaxID=1723647 RepID=UPI001E5DE1F3|nr:hypothetical protein [Prochlorococcus sp. MIT 1303]